MLLDQQTGNFQMFSNDVSANVKLAKFSQFQ